MLPWQEALIKKLLQTVAVTNITNEINWVAIPEEGGATSLTLTVVSDPPAYHHEGRDDLLTARVQFDCRSSRYLTTRQLERAVSFAMEQPQTIDTVSFEEGIKLSGFDAPKETAEGGSVGFRYTMDYMVMFRAAE